MRRRVVAVEAENGIVDRYDGSAAVFTDMKQNKLTKSGAEKAGVTTGIALTIEHIPCQRAFLSKKRSHCGI